MALTPDSVQNGNANYCPFAQNLEVDAVVEEIEDDANASLLTHHSGSPTQQQLLCPKNARREFGNISPISELLGGCDSDEDELGEVASTEKNPGDVGKESDDDDVDDDDATGKITPEPGLHPPHHRASFPRISDGRSSPILAYSPSLIKSPSSNGSGNGRKPPGLSTSPTSSGSAGKRTRNIARILDNISDHSSGEEEVNNVNLMMSKFTV